MKAVIYIRVSSSLQAQKASPKEQERDCREYAKSKDYDVIHVYRDIEQYRVKNRFVEPSGTRSDRPRMLQLLKDAESGLFDVVIAWREDRLYRGIRPMLKVLDIVEAGHANIELVKGTFDVRYAPLMASIGKMETDAMKDRMTLGVKARLEQKKSWGGYKRYGYAKDGDLVVIHPEESKWVKQIFDWYISGVGVREIARRLIHANAPPKHGRKQHYKWQLSSIYRILKCEIYATGIHKVQRDGEIFELPVPIILDKDVWKKAQEILRANHSNKARNVKNKYLLQGLIACPCGSSWHAYTSGESTRYWTKKSTGERMAYTAKPRYYRCARVTASVERITHPDCPRTKGVVRIDEYVWDHVSNVIKEPNLLFDAANAKLAELKEKYAEATKTERVLQKKLEDIDLERQIYIKKFGVDSAKGGPFSEKDLDIALENLSEQEVAIKRELAELALLTDNRVFDLEELVESYLLDVKAGLEWLDKEPNNSKEKDAQFVEQRRIVKALVDRVTLSRNADPKITLRLDLSSVDEKVHSITS